MSFVSLTGLFHTLFILRRHENFTPLHFLRLLLDLDWSVLFVFFTKRFVVTIYEPITLSRLIAVALVSVPARLADNTCAMGWKSIPLLSTPSLKL
jgi:hypothetical protein